MQTSYSALFREICGKIPEHSYNFYGKLGLIIILAAILAVPATGYSIDLIGQIDTPGSARAVSTSNNLLFVADGPGGLQIIDIEEPTLPALVSSLVIDDYVSDIEILDSIALLAAGPSGVVMADISDPLTAVLIGYIPVPYAESITVHEGLVYIASGDYGLWIAKITDPQNPTIIAAIDTPGFTEAVAIENRLAYIADGPAGLQIVDLIQKKVVGSIATGSFAKSIALKDQSATAQAGNYACVADGYTGQITVVDIGNPANPAVVANIYTIGRSSNMVINNNLLFAANGAAGIQIVDIADPKSPSQLQAITASDYASDILIKGSLGIVADRAVGLAIYDLSNILGVDKPSIRFLPTASNVPSPFDFSFIISAPEGPVLLDLDTFLLTVNDGQARFGIADLESLAQKGIIRFDATDTEARVSVPGMRLPRGETKISISIALLTGETAQASIVYRVDNNRPVANPGTDMVVNEGERAPLNGSGSWDADGDPLSYRWAQTAGQAVILLEPVTGKDPGNNVSNPIFIVPAPAVNNVLTFQLLVNDGREDSIPATVRVRINRKPMANAGQGRKVIAGNTVTLDGSGSYDPEGDPINYLWRQTAGYPVSLSNPTVKQPSFTAAAAGDGTPLTFELVVNDGRADSNPATVDVVINRRPIADAGQDQTAVVAWQAVTLDGSGSADPDGNTLTYRWNQVAGPGITLNNPNSRMAHFTAPPDKGNVTRVFQLIVNDGMEDSEPDTVAVTVKGIFPARGGGNGG